MALDTRDPIDLCGVTIDAKNRVASVVSDGGFGVVYRGVRRWAMSVPARISR